MPQNAAAARAGNGYRLLGSTLRMESSSFIRNNSLQQECGIPCQVCPESVARAWPKTSMYFHGIYIASIVMP